MPRGSAAGFGCNVYESPWHGRNVPEWDADQERMARWIRTLPKPLGLMACNDVRGQQVLNACRSVDVAEVIDQLDCIHVVLDTPGYGSDEDFRLLLGEVDLVLFDLKVMDPAEHRRHTGGDNAPILRNLETLSASGVPFVIRVPLIPGVTDGDENLTAIADAVRGSSNLVRVELLAYNRAAGGKYAPCGMTFRPSYDESRRANANTAIFSARGIPAVVADDR